MKYQPFITAACLVLGARSLADDWRVVCAGLCALNAAVRSANRNRNTTDNRNKNTGFRLASTTSAKFCCATAQQIAQRVCSRGDAGYQ